MKLLVEKFATDELEVNSNNLYCLGARVSRRRLLADLDGEYANLFVAARVNSGSIVINLEKPWLRDHIEMRGGEIELEVDARMPKERLIYRLKSVGASLTIIDDREVFSFTAND
ncbi:hypothetical protein HYV64_02475 [Candidatus Shapirobacteria bacterium]|nr:hypothetical protein [Candidatus Shapirobacteria bacterium]